MLWIPEKIFVLCSILSVLLAGAAAAQSVTRQDLTQELRASGGFSDEEIRRIEDGEVVIKELERTTKREVAIIGAIRLEYEYELAKKGFERTVVTQRRESAREYGRFSDPPALSNMDSLEFEMGELEDLKACRVGDCDWNLSETIIKALNTGIDWESKEAAARASDTVKSGLVQYLGQYMREGDAALMVYRDTDLRVSLADEYKTLLADLMFIDKFDRDFANFIRAYPKGRPDGADDQFSWSEVKIGFKPVVMITHTLQSETATDEKGMTLSVSKQIFANHYFDSTLGITALFGFPPDGGRPVSYLVFVSRSRASALRGRLSGLLRGLIEDQAKGKLRDFLADAKKYTALASANREAAAEREALLEAQSESPWYLSWPFVTAAAIAVFAIMALLLMRARRG